MNIIDVLDKICEKIESMDPIDSRFLRSKGNDNGFEELFPLIAEKVAEELAPQNKLEFKVHLGHHFPDVDLILNDVKFGIELKYRGNGSWITNGNSVFESITSEDYEEIYLMFGSKVPKKNRMLVKFAPYWQATSSIKVTHSPRFTIDMGNLSESIFTSKEEYDSLRKMEEIEKVSFVQKFLKENSGGAKWYITPTATISPTKFSSLPCIKKDQIRTELLILFPDDLLHGDSRSKYIRSAEYLLETYYVYNSSLRDLFSSGGVYIFKNTDFPKIIGTLVSLKEQLNHTLYNASDDFFELCKDNWSKTIPPHLISNNLYDSYTAIIDYLGSKEPYSNLLKQANIANMSEMLL